MLPGLVAESGFRRQVIGLVIEPAVEARRWKLSCSFTDQALNPRQPSRVFYWCSHPFRVKRLSAKAPEGHRTGVISCARELRNMIA
jgi:hypothetical protein